MGKRRGRVQGMYIYPPSTPHLNEIVGSVLVFPFSRLAISLSSPHRDLLVIGIAIVNTTTATAVKQYQQYPNTLLPYTQRPRNQNMSFLKRYSLRTRDDQRTRAAELTLRQSIYPLFLVTILFFLWVNQHLPSQHLLSDTCHLRASPTVSLTL